MRDRLLAVIVMGLVVGVALAGVAWWFKGTAGVWAALLAVAVCCGGLTGAAIAKSIWDGDEFGAAPVLLGIMFRMALPLAACGAVGWQQGWAFEAGFVVWSLIAYPVLLAADTILDVRRMNRKHSTVS